jgi:hypothetical protein
VIDDPRYWALNILDDHAGDQGVRVDDEDL